MLNFKTVNSVCIFLFFALFSLDFFLKISLWLYLLIILVWLVITIIGSFHIRWNYHIKSLNFNPKTTNNHVAITFDDGPNPEFTPQVLSLLETYNAKATFFCVGKHIEAYPKIFKSIIKKGHTIGNHTFSHTNCFGFLSAKKVVSELQQTNTIVKTQTGLNIQLYRPAFGVTNPKIKRALKTTGLQSVGWNKRSLDTTSLSNKKVLRRITKNLKKGDVILLHDTSSRTIEVLEQLLLFLQQQNMESVTIDSLFNLKAYA